MCRDCWLASGVIAHVAVLLEPDRLGSADAGTLLTKQKCRDVRDKTVRAGNEDAIIGVANTAGDNDILGMEQHGAEGGESQQCEQ